MKRELKKGDMYRPRVHIKKVKNGLPTIIELSGQRYILEHKDQFKGAKRKWQYQTKRN